MPVSESVLWWLLAAGLLWLAVIVAGAVYFGWF
jgi:hypothetical protein